MKICICCHREMVLGRYDLKPGQVLRSQANPNICQPCERIERVPDDKDWMGREKPRPLHVLPHQPGVLR